ncbi:MAG: hypothetical protein JWQ11_1359 [Rhizobacter sp.]|nr:hypothetical protein [Rhizobacter sp.]
MLTLDPEQVDLLRTLDVRRTATAVAQVLAQAFPTVVGRLADRWPAFVDAAVGRGGEIGLALPRDLAVYAGLCCVFGVGFEDRAGFEWAAAVVRDPRRSAALRLHQLVNQGRHALQPAPGVARAGGLAPADFDLAMAAIDAQMVRLSASSAVYIVDRPVARLAACDVAKVEFQSGHPSPPQEYQPAGGAWKRVPAPVLVPIALRLSEPLAQDEPFVVLSRAAGEAAPVTIAVRADMLAVCDARVHPELTHRHGSELRVWRGRDALRVVASLTLAGAPPVVAPAGLPPPPGSESRTVTSIGLVPDPGAPAGIAATAPPELHTIDVSTCGVRDTGAPNSSLGLSIAVVPAAQRWFEVRHPPWGQRAWPQAAGGPAPDVRPKTGCRLEIDGAPRLPVTWQREWHGLHDAIDEGLERLFNTFDRSTGGHGTRLEAQVSALAGQASMTWGYRQIDATHADMRCEGRIDMAGCTLDLRLSGEVEHGGARSRVRLAARGQGDFAQRLMQVGRVAAETEALDKAVRHLRLPIAIEVDAISTPALSTLVAAPSPPALWGAFVADYGLRPRADGAGLQWFFTLRVEVSTLMLAWRDPVLGHDLHQRVLLPTMTLVDWSAG